MIAESWYQLRDAVRDGDFGNAEALLKTNPLLSALRNGVGETVLHSLAAENDFRGVCWLHGHGFSLDEQNHFGTPTLFEVAQLEYRELFLWFLQNGANPHAENHEGNDLITYLREHGQHEMASVFMEAVPGLRSERRRQRGGSEQRP